MRTRSKGAGIWLTYAALGAVLMILMMHPALEAIHQWRSGFDLSPNMGSMLIDPIRTAFSPEMLPMTLLLGALGVLFGLAFAWLHRRIVGAKESTLLTRTSPEDLDALISQGESETLEFKSSLRWDVSKGKVNKQLEAVVAKTLTGLMNHQGGVLLIGVEDSGLILGIEDDLQTLREPTWDRFEQRLVAVATDYIGGRHCSRIHCSYTMLNAQMVAVVRVEPSPVPAYCKDGHSQLYYVRAGNTTRELNTREAVAHIEEHQQS
ncbi:ATP-binding protein [Coraliomargarita sp. SDUM461004]|uniref:ATP-binding protein n=1 Tax=Thalassobacterium sedimentorum TaxID=3041258 RepID=A0ABU1AKF9_9BACT|nr:ATP-binding protein [Coraliomargarita sp. SDUM461004]MDQ8195305.1 ATP-binding protein [Coraliomargarita sp. SDUM461004]